MLGEMIREAIKTCGESCHGLAKRAGMNPQTLYRFVDGTNDLTLSSADPLCAVLGLVLCKVNETPNLAPVIEARARQLAAVEMMTSVRSRGRPRSHRQERRLLTRPAGGDQGDDEDQKEEGGQSMIFKGPTACGFETGAP